MGTRRSRATSSAWCAAARCSTSRRFSPSSTSKASAPRFHPSSEPSKRPRSEEHTSELQSQSNLVCRLLLEKKKLEEQHNRFELEPPPPHPTRPPFPLHARRRSAPPTIVQASIAAALSDAAIRLSDVAGLV